MTNDTKIFISYRRSDSEHIVERIYKELTDTYGSKSVFKDTYSIPLGSNFPDYILSKLSETKVFVLVVGKTFLTSTNAQEKPRLFDENDYLRIEIETALKLGITIIPILDKDVSYPSPKDLPESIRKFLLANALQLAGPVYFKVDMGNLTAAINQIIKTKKTLPSSTAPVNKKKILFASLLLIAVLIGGFAFYQSKKNNTEENKSNAPGLTIKFNIRGISSGADIQNFNLITLNAAGRSDSMPIVKEGNGYYVLISNVNERMKGMRFDISLNSPFAQKYSIPETNSNRQYIFTDTTYELLVEETSSQTDIRTDSSNKIVVKKNQTKDSVDPSDRIGSGATLSTPGCKLSGVEFIDAETLDDNLTFFENGKNQYSFSGRIGHRFDVDGNATLKGNQLFLSGEKTSGTLTLMDCNNLIGTLKTGPSKTSVRIVFKKK